MKKEYKEFMNAIERYNVQDISVYETKVSQAEHIKAFNEKISVTKMKILQLEKSFKNVWDEFFKLKEEDRQSYLTYVLTTEVLNCIKDAWIEDDKVKSIIRKTLSLEKNKDWDGAEKKEYEPSFLKKMNGEKINRKKEVEMVEDWIINNYCSSKQNNELEGFLKIFLLTMKKKAVNNKFKDGNEWNQIESKLCDEIKINNQRYINYKIKDVIENQKEYIPTKIDIYNSDIDGWDMETKILNMSYWMYGIKKGGKCGINALNDMSIAWSKSEMLLAKVKEVLLEDYYKDVDTKTFVDKIKNNNGVFEIDVLTLIMSSVADFFLKKNESENNGISTLDVSKVALPYYLDGLNLLVKKINENLQCGIKIDENKVLKLTAIKDNIKIRKSLDYFLLEVSRIPLNEIEDIYWEKEGTKLNIKAKELGDLLLSLTIEMQLRNDLDNIKEEAGQTAIKGQKIKKF